MMLHQKIMMAMWLVIALTLLVVDLTFGLLWVTSGYATTLWVKE